MFKAWLIFLVRMGLIFACDFLTLNFHSFVCHPKIEHMIFMGSEKYPSENEFDQFMQKSGGFDNADTDFDETSFYFDTREEFLDEALDRFSQFFKAPLMLKEAMTREREAVESEFASKKNGEDVRRGQLLSSIGQTAHPSSIFAWGNLETLKDNIDDEALYKKVHEFRERHYSAHRMYVCLQSNKSLVDLQVCDSKCLNCRKINLIASI